MTPLTTRCGCGRPDAGDQGAGDSTRPSAWCARCAADRVLLSTIVGTQSREGTFWLDKILRAAGNRRGHEDIDKLLDISDSILGKSFCAL